MSATVAFETPLLVKTAMAASRISWRRSSGLFRTRLRLTARRMADPRSVVYPPWSGVHTRGARAAVVATGASGALRRPDLDGEVRPSTTGPRHPDLSYGLPAGEV